MIEYLEKRRLLSAALGDDLDVVITGSPTDDDIAVVAEGNTIIISEGGHLSFFDRAQQKIFNVRVKSLGGNDRISISGDLFATVFAGRGNDWISSGSGNDILYGGRGNDTIFGNDGIDVLTGGAGRDLLKGGAGDDILNGFDGRPDVLIGGDGSDFGRVDEGLEFARGTERLLKIDPHDSSFRRHQLSLMRDFIMSLWAGSYSAGIDVIQVPQGSGGTVVNIPPPTGSRTPRVGDLNLDGKITIAQFIAMARVMEGSTPV